MSDRRKFISQLVESYTEACKYLQISGIISARDTHEHPGIVRASCTATAISSMADAVQLLSGTTHNIAEAMIQAAKDGYGQRADGKPLANIEDFIEWWSQAMPRSMRQIQAHDEIPPPGGQN